MTTPASMLPEMTFPAPAAVPPSVAAVRAEDDPVGVGDGGPPGGPGADQVAGEVRAGSPSRRRLREVGDEGSGWRPPVPPTVFPPGVARGRRRPPSATAGPPGPHRPGVGAEEAAGDDQAPGTGVAGESRRSRRSGSPGPRTPSGAAPGRRGGPEFSPNSRPSGRPPPAPPSSSIRSVASVASGERVGRGPGLGVAVDHDGFGQDRQGGRRGDRPDARRREPVTGVGRRDIEFDPVGAGDACRSRRSSTRPIAQRSEPAAVPSLVLTTVKTWLSRLRASSGLRAALARGRPSTDSGWPDDTGAGADGRRIEGS